MLYTRLGHLAILLLLLLPSQAVFAQTPELTSEQVQQLLEQKVPREPVYVPGQIIVKMQDDVALPAGALRSMGLDTTVVAISEREFIYQIPPATMGAMAADQAQESAEEIARRLAARPDIDYAELNQYNFIASHPFVSVPEVALPSASAVAPGDPRYSDQWHYWNNGTGNGESPGGINLPDAWNTTKGDRGIVVSVIDTGILPNHNDTDPANLISGYDMISNTFISNDGDGRDADPTDPGNAVAANECSPPAPPHPPYPDSWHGTHVAGTVGFVDTDNNVGVSGVNWEVSVQPIRVLGKCGGTTADISAAIRWAAGLPVPGVPVNTSPARVINLSLGGWGACTSAYQTAIDNAVNAGAIIVVAAGNDGVNASNFHPANCNNVITVAASDHQGSLASRYSNYGSTIEIMAPGGDVSPTHSNGVLSTTGRGYEFYNGTSMAAPHVSGVAALWLAHDPSLTGAAVLTRMQSKAMTRSTAQCPDPCGAGLIDADQFGQPVVMLSLSHGESIRDGGTVDATATVTQAGSPVPGITVKFAIGDSTLVEIVGPSQTQTTDGNGRATVTLRGIAKRGETTVTATITGDSDVEVVRVPDLSLLGIAMLLALMLAVEIRRRRAGSLSR